MRTLVQTTLAQIHSQATACLDTLLAQASSDTPPANAQSYLEAGERGAARYELRLLACSLAKK